mmetsp:Transcript_28385/g.94242  ORF Transcript_28385/g.94242 Transcript_28385/m.94242 type:complete len:204 (+) Transcript_28385:98-709(+)
MPAGGRETAGLPRSCTSQQDLRPRRGPEHRRTVPLVAAPAAPACASPDAMWRQVEDAVSMSSHRSLCSTVDAGVLGWEKEQALEQRLCQFAKLLEERCSQLQDSLSKQCVELVGHSQSEARAGIMAARVADLEERCAALELAQRRAAVVAAADADSAAAPSSTVVKDRRSADCKSSKTCDADEGALDVGVMAMGGGGYEEDGG